jgi:lipoprotein-anchoring transpeptidase ErfK/SrfK
LAIWLLLSFPEDDMSNRAGWMTRMVMEVMVAALGTLASVPATAAEAATAVTAPPATALPVTAPPPRRIIVSIADRRMLVVEHNDVLAAFAVAVGAPTTPSPVGTFTVISRVTRPTYHRGGKTIAAGAGNPVGTRWIGLSRKGYGIHGTNAPSSIGHAKSHGCIRLRNADIERLFEQVRAGDSVELLAERTPEFTQLFAHVH